MKEALATSVLVASLSLGCSAPDDAAAPPGPPAGSGGSAQQDGAGTGGVAQAGSGGALAAGSGGNVTPPTGAGSGGALPGSNPNPLGHVRCQAPPGMGSPGTIEQALALLNALPKPTSVACFVESLDRPLAISATNSFNSAQPALDSASPRVFIKIGQLWLSIVIAGEASKLLEFGYLLPDPLELRSIKGELHFPLATEVAPGAPYDGVLYNGGSICRVCHFDERPETVPGLQNVFSSAAFRPRPDSRVPLERVRHEAQTCDWQVQPARCEMLSAVFDGGPVTEALFPEEMPTFF